MDYLRLHWLLQVSHLSAQEPMRVEADWDLTILPRYPHKDWTIFVVLLPPPCRKAEAYMAGIAYSKTTDKRRYFTLEHTGLPDSAMAYGDFCEWKNESQHEIDLLSITSPDPECLVDTIVKSVTSFSS